MTEVILLSVTCACLLGTLYFQCVTSFYTRASRLSVRAASAYRNGDIRRGDALSTQARQLRDRADRLIPWVTVGKGDDDDM